VCERENKNILERKKNGFVCVNFVKLYQKIKL